MNKFDRFKLLNVLQFLIFAVIGLIFCLVINGFWGWVLFGGWLLGVWLHMESASAFLTIEKNWIIDKYIFMQFQLFAVDVKNALKFGDYERIKTLLNELENDKINVEILKSESQ